EGYFAQQAVRILHGQVPYRDFATFYTPGLAYLHAALFGLVGTSSLVALRGLALLARAALAFLLFALARPLVRQPLWAALPGVFLLLAFDDAPVRWEPHPGWLSTVFAVLATYCLTRRQPLAAGLAAGLSYAFKQNTGLVILAAIILCLLLERTASRRAVAWTLVGFGAATLVWLVPLVVTLRGDVSALGVLVGAVNQAGLFSPPESGMLIPVTCLAGGLWLWKREPDVRWLTLAGAALLLTQYPRMDNLHLVWSAPLLLVVGAIALDRLPSGVALAATAVAVALVWATPAERLAYLAEPRAPVADVEAPAQTAADITAITDEVRRVTAPGEHIFVYPTSPLLYVLADRPNPTPFDHLNPGAASPAQIEQVIADIARANVRLVVVSDFWRTVWGDPGPNAPLETYLASHYNESARYGAYRLLVRPAYNAPLARMFGGMADAGARY
ncbi:MAG TPA: hypothetical protein VGQ62_11925, partial [Chloroflexota bacterium]|nr:hypothetical protein [Chloroflexota bacterium]